MAHNDYCVDLLRQQDLLQSIARAGIPPRLLKDEILVIDHKLGMYLNARRISSEGAVPFD